MASGRQAERGLLATFTARKLPLTEADVVVGFAPHVTSLSDYYPFGSGMEGRTVDGSYRYGFQGQETDAEYFNGAVSFKYRVHDARLGRFLSIDPLAPDYPWNSTYAFSENRVIDGVELEGLEMYFIADGTYLGSIGNSAQVRVLSSREVWDEFQSTLQSPETRSTRKLSENLRARQALQAESSSIRNRRDIVGPIYDAIFERAIGDLRDLPQGRVVVLLEQRIRGQDGYARRYAIYGSLSNEQRLAAALVIADAMTFADGTIAMDGAVEYDNYYDIVSVLFHENLHRTNPNRFTGDAFGEFDAHATTMEQDWYRNTSVRIKRSDLKSLEGYLDEQERYLNNEGQGDSTRARTYRNNRQRFDRLMESLDDAD